MPTLKAGSVAETFFDATRHRGFTLQINKGLSGESAEARKRDLYTALHPDCCDAVLVICASLQTYRYLGFAGHEPAAAGGSHQAVPSAQRHRQPLGG